MSVRGPKKKGEDWLGKKVGGQTSAGDNGWGANPKQKTQWPGCMKKVRGNGERTGPAKQQGEAMGKKRKKCWMPYRCRKKNLVKKKKRSI